jgi:transposase
LKDEMMCWTFLKDPDIPLTNNRAESAIRPYVIWRKLSFATQSYQGDQFRPMILTIIGTAQRLGISTAQLLRQVCTEGLEKNKVSMKLPFGENTLPSP